MCSFHGSLRQSLGQLGGPVRNGILNIFRLGWHDGRLQLVALTEINIRFWGASGFGGCAIFNSTQSP